MKRINLILSLTFLVLLTACKSKSNLETIVLDYFSTNEELIGFGKISVGQITELSKAENIPFFGALIKEELKGIKACIDIENYIYLGMDGTDADNISVTTFAAVKSIDSLSNYLKERGYTIEKKNNINITEEDELLFVFDKDLIAIRASNNQEKESFIQTFNALKNGKGKANNAIEKALAKNAPISMTFFPDRAYKLNSDEELKEYISGDLYKGILQSVDMQFLNGKIEITNEFLGDKDKLAKLNFIQDTKTSQSFKISGKDVLTLSLNVDLERIEKENSKWFNYLFSKLEDDVTSEPSGKDLKGIIRMFSSKDHPLTSVFNGILFVTADKSEKEMPTIKFHIGSTNTAFKDYLKELLLQTDASAELTTSPNAIEGVLFPAATALSYTQNSGAAEHVFKLSVDMEYVAEMAELMQYPMAIYAKPLKNIDFYSKGNITKLTITTKDSSKNALEYLVNSYVSF